MVELQNEDKLNEIIDKKIGDEIDGSIISEVFEGYKFKITGGFDKDGFAMKNGILSQAKKKVLLTKGCSLFRFRKGYHRTGIRIRRLVRGCIVSHDIKNLHLKIIKKGPKEIEGLTTEKDAQPKRLGPKRATRILKEFGLYSTYQEKKKDKEQRKNLRFMITKFAPKREVKTKNGKTYVKRPKIQRLITPDRLRRKRLLKKFHEERKAKAKKEEEDYRALIKKIFSKKNKVKKEPLKSEKEKVLHPGITCSSCKGPIYGSRYKCTICTDFDFCEKCEEKDKGEHGHPLLKLNSPEMCPVDIKCILK